MQPNLHSSDIHSVAWWLEQASYFNIKWHKLDYLITDDLSHLSKIEQDFLNAKRQAFLTQKNNCQLTAIQLAYDNQDTSLLIDIDESETGVRGDGVYYGMRLANSRLAMTHIPKDVLFEYLTDKERAFFGIV